MRTAARAAVAALAIAAAPPTLRSVIRDAGFEGVAVAGGGAVPSTVVATGLAAPGVPNRATATWRWASVTKQLAAIIVMQEVAAGRLALDAPVARTWPDWPQVFADEVTIRDLLRHTSGLADPNEPDPAHPDALPPFYTPAPGHGTMAWSATHFCAEHPRAKPGGGFHYDNCDFIVLGALLERTTGKPFATLLDERIGRPAGVSIGLFRPGVRPAAHVGGLDRRGRPDVIGDLGVYGASGSAYGTPLALYAIDRALLDGRLLPPAALAEMWAGDPALGAAALGQWAYDAPLAGCAAPVRIVERRGQIGGVQVRNFILPDSRRALVLFTRNEGFAFGEVWQGRGFAHAALSAVACAA
jgi:CubicO group peptidase (beta-lactamase class C family)